MEITPNDLFRLMRRQRQLKPVDRNDMPAMLASIDDMAARIDTGIADMTGIIRAAELKDRMNRLRREKHETQRLRYIGREQARERIRREKRTYGHQVKPHIPRFD